MKSVQNAFTLIELLIVISVITIITGFILPNFNSYIDTQNTKQAQEQVKDDLRTVQNRALNGDTSSELISGVKVAYWGVYFQNGVGNYTFFVSTVNNVCPPQEGVARVTKKTSSLLPAGNVIRSNTGCVFFSFANGDAYFSPVAAAQTIVGPVGAATGCRRVIVSTNGLIVVNASVACS